jgi:hypothetical protein
VSYSNSFSEEEIACMDQLVRKLLAGESVEVLRRSPAFASLARKFQHMRDSGPSHRRVSARRTIPTSS